MRFANLLVLCLIATTVYADEASDKARSAIALASARRQREAAKTDGHCIDNLDDALVVAKRERRPLVMWVGMNCVDSPIVRDALPDAVHCHLETYENDATPRIAFNGTDGRSYQIPKTTMTDGSGLVIRQVVGLPSVPKWK